MSSFSDEKLKNELVIIVLDKIYKDDIQNYEKNLEYLQGLSLEQIDRMLFNYYLYNIKNDKEI